MKFGVSSYSFSKLIDSGEMTQFDTIKKAKEMGFDFIEFAGLAMPQGEAADSYAARLREECDRQGIPAGPYCTSADLLYGSDGNLDDEIDRLKGELKLAKILGAPAMRHDATFRRDPLGFGHALPRLIKGCRTVTEYAAELKIKTMVENHGFFCQDSERVEALVNGVCHPNFGLLVDIGNFLCVDENPASAVGRVAPYAFHVHAKDFHTKSGSMPDPGRGWFRTSGGNYLRGAIIGHGEVPVGQCLQLLHGAGYDGMVTIEFEGMENPLEAIPIGLENLKRM